MPIKWSALRVSEATDMIEEFLNQAREPLEQARIVAKEAQKIPNLPDYMNQRLHRLIFDIDKALDGWLGSDVKAIRDDIPQGTLEAERKLLNYGHQQTIV